VAPWRESKKWGNKLKRHNTDKAKRARKCQQRENPDPMSFVDIEVIYTYIIIIKREARLVVGVVGQRFVDLFSSSDVSLTLLVTNSYYLLLFISSLTCWRSGGRNALKMVLAIMSSAGTKNVTVPKKAKASAYTIAPVKGKTISRRTC
jgi:hypothetical protein